jgi:hypothetical protein
VVTDKDSDMTHPCRCRVEKNEVAFLQVTAVPDPLVPAATTKIELVSSGVG